MQKTPIHYSQCWEDTDLLLNALRVNERDRILSITSGGCNTLALASVFPRSIDAVDVSKAQYHLLELKICMLKSLDHEQVMELMGVFSSDYRIDLYNTVRALLSNDSQIFWDKNKELIKTGIAHSGKFEKYLRYFSRYLLPLAHGKRHIEELLKPKSREEQEYFYQFVWNNLNWRLLFQVFFSEPVMKKAGRSREMFYHANIRNVSAHYLSKTKEAFTKPTVFNNPYLEYILKGNYEDQYPYILQPHNFLRIKEQLHRINNNNCDLLDYLKRAKDNYFTKMNLSDVFEPLTLEKTHHIFEEIVRVCKAGARIIFWNNLVPRNIPDHLSEKFHKESELEAELHASEKVFFYETLNIYTLTK